MCAQRIRRRLLFLGWVLLLPTSCSMDTPSAPPRDNPLDIHNPQTSGDPFALQVERVDDGMRLRWARVTGPAIAGYDVYRRVDGGELALLRWVDEATAELVDTDVESCATSMIALRTVGVCGRGDLHAARHTPLDPSDNGHSAVRGWASRSVSATAG